MRCLLLRLAIFVPAIAYSQAPVITSIQNSADYHFEISYESMVSIFGSGFGSGEFHSEFGTNPTDLGGVSVQVCPASIACYKLPLVYVGPKQINFVTPNAGAAFGPIKVVVQDNLGTQESGLMGWQLIGYRPAVFVFQQDCSIDARYTGYVQCDGSAGGTHLLDRGAITDVNNHPITSKNPARIDQPLQMYLTGMGPFTDGKPDAGVQIMATNLPVFVYPSDTYRLANILYTGKTPWQLGENQINLSIPKSLFYPAYSGISEMLPCADLMYEISIAIAQGKADEMQSDIVSYRS